jgi:hypothetical protein
VTFIYEEGDDYQKRFRTLRGAVAHGCTRLRAHGYLAANRWLGSHPHRRHVVAEWKDRGIVRAMVWT